MVGIELEQAGTNTYVSLIKWNIVAIHEMHRHQVHGSTIANDHIRIATNLVKQTHD